MYTRQDYLAGKCTHSEYYTQLVGDTMKRHVIQSIGLDRILKSTDEHFNDIPLILWDDLTFYVNSELMRELGDFPTLAGKVCIAKEAARQLKAKHNKEAA